MNANVLGKKKCAACNYTYELQAWKKNYDAKKDFIRIVPSNDVELKAEIEVKWPRKVACPQCGTEGETVATFAHLFLLTGGPTK